MTPFFHGTFTIRRKWAAAPARIFRAWSDPQIKLQWFTGPMTDWTLTRHDLDFRVGGTEVVTGRFNTSGMVPLFEARFHLIEPDQRLVYAYDLHHDGHFHSITLASLTLAPEGEMTAVSYTEQIVFLDGQDGTESRRHGTGMQYDMLETLLRNGTF
jgi:uncharacterized protein YndB with AHSA1/START domain